MAADERQAVSNIQIALHRQPVGKYDVVLVYFDVPVSRCRDTLTHDAAAVYQGAHGDQHVLGVDSMIRR